MKPTIKEIEYIKEWTPKCKGNLPLFAEKMLGIELHKGQLRVIAEMQYKFYPTNLVLTGNRFGKTVMLAVKHIYKAFYKECGQGVNIDPDDWEHLEYVTIGLAPSTLNTQVMLRYIMQMVRGQFPVKKNGRIKKNESKIRYLIDLDGLRNYDKIPDQGPYTIKWANKSQSKFFTLGLTHGDSIQGSAFAYSSYDEFGRSKNPEKEIADILPRLIDFNGELDIITTPDIENELAVSYILQKQEEAKAGSQEVRLIRGNTEENPHIPTEDLKKRLSGQSEDKQRQILYGDITLLGANYFDIEAVNEVFKPHFLSQPFRGAEIYVGLDTAGCLGGETMLRIRKQSKVDGRRLSGKQRTIEEMYKRYKKGEFDKYDWYCQSVLNGEVITNKIERVWESGEKELYELTTEDGHKIKSTLEHKFMLWSGKFIELEYLQVGDEICHNPRLIPNKGGKNYRNPKEIYVKFHPKGRIKRRKDGVINYRLYEYQAVYEAYKNKMTLEEYVSLLNNFDGRKIWYIPHGYDIHHINGDYKDNRVENMIMLTHKDHQKLHHTNNSKENLIKKVSTTKIKSIKKIGLMPSFDMSCSYPAHNYTANGLVVHNSGNDYWALTFICTSTSPWQVLETYYDKKNQPATNLAITMNKLNNYIKYYGREKVTLVMDYTNEAGSIYYGDLKEYSPIKYRFGTQKLTGKSTKAELTDTLRRVLNEKLIKCKENIMLKHQLLMYKGPSDDEKLVTDALMSIALAVYYPYKAHLNNLNGYVTDLD